MSAKERKTYQPAPVSTIELSDQHSTGRLVLVVFLLILAGVAFYFAIKARATAAPGWQKIDAVTTEASCADEFTLYYSVGAEGRDATADFRAVTALYTNAALHAYRIFHPEQEFDAVGNLALVNHHPNEAVSVDPVLYKALETVVNSGDRRIFLGPLYRQYRIIFECDNDVEAADADPNRDPELKEFAKKLAALASDPAEISLEFLGGNQLKLNMGEAYAALLKEWGDPPALDTGRLKNALIADYLAEQIAGQGPVHAYITSKDGYARTLYSGAGEAKADAVIYSRQGQAVYPAAMLNYSPPMSLVYFRSYPAAAASGLGYIYEDGMTVTDWICEEDGLNRTSLPELLCLSSDRTCTQIVLENEDLFTAGQFDENRLSCGAVWTEGTAVCTRGDGFTVSDLLESEEIKFTLRQ